MNQFVINKSEIRTRFSPSPTGVLHVGGARTALFNWLFARRYTGNFILRLEDTDRNRCKEEYVKSIIEAMEWLDLNWDEGPFFQSQRFDRYRNEANKLVNQGKAYWCHCSPNIVKLKREEALIRGDKPRYDGSCRNLNLSPAPGGVIRFRGPQVGITVFNDLVKGFITFNHAELDDLVIWRSDGTPTYHLAVVVDDIDMSISHLIRGDDHINNTPRQILLYQALGSVTPFFAHLPMIFGLDKAKLSKRYGATSILEYRKLGYLPEAIINALVRLGWSYGNQEIFILPELINFFSLKTVGSSAAIFNPNHLLYLNHQHIQRAGVLRLASLLSPFLLARGIKNWDNEMLIKILPYLVVRTSTLAELADWAEPYLIDEPIININIQNQFLNSHNIIILNYVKKLVEVNGVKDNKFLKQRFSNLATDIGTKLGAIAQPVRVALTGRTATPGIFEIMGLLGREQVLKRLMRAIELAKASF